MFRPYFYHPYVRRSYNGKAFVLIIALLFILIIGSKNSSHCCNELVGDEDDSDEK